MDDKQHFFKNINFYQYSSTILNNYYINPFLKKYGYTNKEHYLHFLFF
jgi:hypothetical protein